MSENGYYSFYSLLAFPKQCEQLTGAIDWIGFGLKLWFRVITVLVYVYTYV